jgi:hypothetical protein
VTLWAFQPGAPPKGNPLSSPRARDSGNDTSSPLLCARCRAVVAQEEARIEMAGAHQHRFTNPAGFTYDVVCLRQAPGCYVQGPTTNDFSWFAGYAWSYALCGACHEHLGWYYEGPTKFFGLIADKLVK